MWKRERMMVDVISLQNKSTQDLFNTVTTANTNLLLQNRTCGYPFGGGKIHDDKNNFFSGNEYNIYGNLTSCCYGNQHQQQQQHLQNKRKRSLPLPVTNNTSNINSTTSIKRVKQQEEQVKEVQQQQKEKPNYNHYTFTSKPYVYMESHMYYY